MTHIHDKLARLTEGPPTFQDWLEIHSILNGLPLPHQEAAVDALEAASAHWPTTLSPWEGATSVPEIELRHSRHDWSRELFEGRYAPKHRTIRVLNSFGRHSRKQTFENLIGAGSLIDNVTQVDLDGIRLSAKFLKSWAGAGPWRRWRAIRIWDCGVKPGALKGLAKAVLPATESLNLDQNRFGPDGVKALVKAPGFTALKHLWMANNQIGDEGAAHLGRADWSARLEMLNLRLSQISDAGVKALGGGGGSALRWLNLGRNEQLTGALSLSWAPSLEFLDLSRCGATDAGITSLMEDPERPETLRGICLNETGIGDDSVDAIVASGVPWAWLELSQTRITPAGLRRLLTSPIAASLERLAVGAALDAGNAKLLIDGACPNMKLFVARGPDVDRGAVDAVKSAGVLPEWSRYYPCSVFFPVDGLSPKQR